MSGAYLLGLIGISMASLFAVAGLVKEIHVTGAANAQKALASVGEIRGAVAKNCE